MQRLPLLIVVLCFMHFEPIDAVFSFLDIIFGDALKRPRPVECDADFTDCHYLKDGTEGVIYIGNKLTARHGAQQPAKLHFHLPEEKSLSGVPGNQHYSRRMKFEDLARRNIMSDEHKILHLPMDRPLSEVPGNLRSRRKRPSRFSQFLREMPKLIGLVNVFHENP